MDIPLPVVLERVLCMRTAKDDDGHLDLGHIITHITQEVFPAILPDFRMVVILSDCHPGTVRLGIVVVDEENKLMGEGPKTQRQFTGDPLRPKVLLCPISGLAIDRPGVYDICVLFNEQFLTQFPLRVNQGSEIGFFSRRWSRSRATFCSGVK
jgi:hypothetical protein